MMCSCAPEGPDSCGRSSGPRVRRRPSGVKRFLCDNRRVVPPLRPVRACALAAATVILLASQAGAGRGAPALPSELPPAARQRLAPVTERASLATRVDGEPFRARRDVFEYLIDHPEFATHVTRAIKAARYKIWAVPGGFGIDDGWGVVGTFEVVYAAMEIPTRSEVDEAYRDIHELKKEIRSLKQALKEATAKTPVAKSGKKGAVKEIEATEASAS